MTRTRSRCLARVVVAAGCGGVGVTANPSSKPFAQKRDCFVSIASSPRVSAHPSGPFSPFVFARKFRSHAPPELPPHPGQSRTKVVRPSNRDFRPPPPLLRAIFDHLARPSSCRVNDVNIRVIRQQDRVPDARFSTERVVSPSARRAISRPVSLLSPPPARHTPPGIPTTFSHSSIQIVSLTAVRIVRSTK